MIPADGRLQTMLSSTGALFANLEKTASLFKKQNALKCGVEEDLDHLFQTSDSQKFATNHQLTKPKPASSTDVRLRDQNHQLAVQVVDACYSKKTEMMRKFPT